MTAGKDAGASAHAVLLGIHLDVGAEGEAHHTVVAHREVEAQHLDAGSEQALDQALPQSVKAATCRP